MQNPCNNRETLAARVIESVTSAPLSRAHAGGIDAIKTHSSFQMVVKSIESQWYRGSHWMLSV